MPAMVSDQDARSFVDALSEPCSSIVVNPPVAQARWWKILPINMLKVGGLMLVIPTLTNVKTKFFNGDTARAAAVQSVAESTRAMFTILVAVQLGKLSDALGRRPLIILSVFCTLVPLMCLTFFPDNLYYYFVMYALAGLLGGQASPAAQAYIADCSAQDDRARIFGFQGASMSAMVMLLPGVTTVIEYHCGRRALFTIAIATECVAALGAFCLLPESLPKEKRQPFVASVGCSMVQTLRQLFLRRGSFLWDLAVLRFLKGMVSGVPTFFAWRSLLDLTDADFSLLMTISGLCSTLVQGVILKFMIRCGCSQLNMIIFSLGVDVCYYSGNLLLGTFPNKFIVFSLYAFDTLSRLYTPAFTALATQGADDDKGFVLGALASIGNMTSFVSPLLMGAVYQVSPLAPFILAASFNVVCIIYSGRLRVRSKDTDAGVALTGEQRPVESVEVCHQTAPTGVQPSDKT